MKNVICWFQLKFTHHVLGSAQKYDEQNQRDLFTLGAYSLLRDAFHQA